ncbi:hypothetical protein DFS34DRAFT_50258 [Phlyctochytrium arcticum]|nr:hypothetical protein DFS34DRAFT_50258 [Phlyctochytrium arcticum]
MANAFPTTTPDLATTLLILLCRSFYVLAITVAVVIVAVPYFKSNLLPYGKTLTAATSSKSENAQHHQGSRITLIIQKLTVPKSWFLHFYIVATVWSSVILYSLLRQLMADNPDVRQLLPVQLLEPLAAHMPNSPAALRFKTSLALSSTDVILAHSCMLLQSVRRLYECLAVHRSSGSRMHVAHYLLGLLYYAVTPLAVGVDGWTSACRQGVSFESFYGGIHPRQIVAVLLFAYASIRQYQTHCHLANLRPRATHAEKGAGKPNYYLPHTKGLQDGPITWWFKKVACPHYFFELLVYIGIAILATPTGWSLADLPSSWYIIPWIITDLGISAGAQLQWYRRKFPSKDLPANWKKMIPWVL